MGSTKDSKRHQILFRILQFLLKVHQQLCKGGQAAKRTHKEDEIFRMVSGMPDSLRKFKETVPRKTSSSHTRSIEAVLCGIQHI